MGGDPDDDADDDDDDDADDDDDDDDDDNCHDHDLPAVVRGGHCHEALRCGCSCAFACFSSVAQQGQCFVTIESQTSPAFDTSERARAC